MKLFISVVKDKGNHYSDSLLPGDYISEETSKVMGYVFNHLYQEKSIRVDLVLTVEQNCEFEVVCKNIPDIEKISFEKVKSIIGDPIENIKIDKVQLLVYYLDRQKTKDLQSYLMGLISCPVPGLAYSSVKVNGVNCNVE